MKKTVLVSLSATALAAAFIAGAGFSNTANAQVNCKASKSWGRPAAYGDGKIMFNELDGRGGVRIFDVKTCKVEALIMMS